MERKGISGSTIKLIAVITMLIDHIGAGILARILVSGGVSGVTGTRAADVFAGLSDYSTLYEIYYVMRMIGRIAFPIYCFLLIEGFFHTRSRAKYAMRLGAFALISEIPFDLAFSGCVLESGHQNVFFTLLLGLLTMTAVQYALEHGKNRLQIVAMELLAMAAGMMLAEFLETDYGALGVFCILVLYFCRKNRIVQAAAGCLAFCWWEPWACLAFLPILLYNGKRGWNLKYFFYAFYPVHLFLIWAFCAWLGIADISAV